MTDTRTPLMEALVARLDGEVGSGVGVFSDIPDNTPPPVVIVDQLAREEAGEKSGGLDLYPFEIVTITKGESRKPLNAIMASVRSRLHDWTPAAPGLIFSSIRFLSDDDSALEDGVKIGRSRFEVYVQPAD